jgi:hypothetical protein
MKLGRLIFYIYRYSVSTNMRIIKIRFMMLVARFISDWYSTKGLNVMRNNADDFYHELEELKDTEE